MQFTRLLIIVLVLALLVAPMFTRAEQALVDDYSAEDEEFYEDSDLEDILIEDIADHGVGRSQRAPHHAHRNHAEWLEMEQQPPVQHTKHHMDDFVRDIHAAAERSAIRDRLHRLEQERERALREQEGKRHDLERAQHLLFDAMRAEEHAHEAYKRVKSLQDQEGNRNQHPLWHNPRGGGLKKHEYPYHDHHNPNNARRIP